MEEIEFSRWLFEGRLRQGKNVLPYGLNWLCYFEGSSKSHLFLGYFNTLETHSELSRRTPQNFNHFMDHIVLQWLVVLSVTLVKKRTSVLTTT